MEAFSRKYHLDMPPVELLDSSIADIRGTGQILFDVQSDGQIEANLSSTGLSLSSQVASANLDVSGNAIISKQLWIGGAQGSSNLHVQGSLSMSTTAITTQGVLQHHSHYLINPDIAAGNLRVRVPPAESNPNQIFHIKNIGTIYDVYIFGDIDKKEGWKLSPRSASQLAYLKLISDGSEYYILSSSDSTINTTIYPEELLCWFKFEDSTGTVVTDSSGLGNHGTLSGNTFDNGSTTGLKNQGLYFDGSDDYIEITGLNDLNADHDQFSIMAWVKLAAFDRALFAENTSSSSKEYYAHITNEQQVSYAYGNSYTTCVSSEKINLDTWVHLAYIIDQTNGKVSIYINGRLTLPNSHVIANFNNGNAPFRIGQNRSSTPANFYGTMDDFRIYKTLLTSDDIRHVIGSSFWSSAPSASRAFGSATSENHYDVGDTIEVTFDTETNQVNVSTKSAVDALLDFGHYQLGSDYRGSWVSPSSLSLEVLGGTGNLGVGATITIKETGKLAQPGGINYSSNNVILWGATNTIMSSNILTWLRLDESSGFTATDSSSSANTGLLYPATFSFDTEAVAGRMAGALSFDGIGDYIEVPHLKDLDQDLNQWSMMGWFKPVSGAEAQIFSQNISGTHKAWGTSILSDGNVKYTYGNSLTARTTTSAPITHDAWNHAAWVIDQDGGVVKIIVNGVDQPLDSSVISHYQLGNPDFFIGRIRSDFGEAVMDDLRVYNTLLTDVQIQSIIAEAN